MYFLIGLAVIILAIVFYCISTYNSIIRNKNAVERAWASVITQERQKNQIIPALEKVVEEHKGFEEGLLKDIIALRSNVTGLSESTIDTAKLQQVESQMSSIMKGIKITMEAYPNLKTTEIMNNLMREISEQQDNIGAAIRIFNQNVELFNNSIQTFPASFINEKYNKETKITPFNDSVAESGFEYKPNFK